ncbi:MAG: DUF6516 family protein [Bacteroidia bacterium]
MEILKWLDDTSIVKAWSFLDSPEWPTGYYYKIKIELINSDLLYASEYFDWDENVRTYTLHWQDKKNNLITRWDNTAHHRHIKTFPFHTHLPNKIIESEEMTLEMVLEIISQHIGNQQNY